MSSRSASLVRPSASPTSRRLSFHWPPPALGHHRRRDLAQARRRAALAVAAAEDQVRVDAPPDGRAGRPPSTGRHRLDPAPPARAGSPAASPRAPPRATGCTPQRQRVVERVDRQREPAAAAWPGTFDSPSTCWTFSGRAVSLRSSKPDSWQPSAQRGHEPRAERGGGGPARRVLLATVHVVALFGPTGVGKTGGRDRAGPTACASAARTRSRSPPTRSRSTAASRSLTGAATRGGAGRGSSTACSRSSTRARRFSAGEFAERAHAEIDAALRSGAAPDRGRRHRPLPPGRAHRPGAAPAARPRRCASADPARAGSRPTARRRCTPSWPRARPTRRRRSTPATAPAWPARSSCSRWGRSRPRAAAESRLWTARLRHPTLLVRPHDGARRACTRASTRAWTR